MSWFDRLLGRRQEPDVPAPPPAPTTAEILASAHQVEQQIAGKVPAAVTARVLRITRTVDDMAPRLDRLGAGYHITQSKIALGSGGLLGKGYGLGSQSQLEFLPEKQTDFIFAAVSEEFGFVGSFTILMCYAGIILIALRIASLSHSHFGRMASAGVTSTFALYVLINGAMVMGLAPVVGVPMPLLSYGGTVMLTVMIGFGLVMATRVHRYAELPKGHGLI